MKKKPAKSDKPISLLDPTGREPIDEDVQVPEQVRRVAALADSRVTGKSIPRAAQPNRTVPYTDAEIEEALQQLERGEVEIIGPNYETIIGLAREGGRLIKAHRRGARESREKSEGVTRRLEALLQAYRELSEGFQKRPTGLNTIRLLRKKVIQKLGLQDEDDLISEDTIRQDIRLVRPYMRLIQQGIIPRTGSPKRQQELSEKAKQEKEEGKRAVAAAESANKAQRRSNRRTKNEA
jgi:hypothetical protein